MEKNNMTQKKFDYEEFNKRYDKFKKNNLPTPFWDEERQTLEYVYFYNAKLNADNEEKELMVHNNLLDALGEIALTNVCYPYTTKYIESWLENGKLIRKSVVRSFHSHSFEEVVESLYSAPESFSIAKDEEQFYSKRELEYLRRVQKYLLFIGMKDLELKKAPVSRYRNKLHAKYEHAKLYSFNDFALSKMLSGERNFIVKNWFENHQDRIYKKKEYQALITDKEDNFKMFVEFTHEEIKTYQEIKKLYKNDELKDSDKVIVIYFKILETF